MSFISRLWQNCKDNLLSKNVESDEESDEEDRSVCVCSRKPAAAPSTGNKKTHEKEYNELIVCALGEISAERLAEMKAEAEAAAKAASEAKAKAAAAKEAAKPKLPAPVEGKNAEKPGTEKDDDSKSKK